MTVRPLLIFLVALLCAALLSGCGSRSWRKGGVPGSRPYTVRGKTYYPLKSANGFVEEGTASWYGPGFHGKTTANGETYNQYAMTAAHKLLPLGTKVRVTHMGNGAPSLCASTTVGLLWTTASLTSPELRPAA